MNAGFYTDLCPLLEFLIRDDSGALVGYAMKAGRVLSAYDFESHVNGALRPLICRATRNSGFYDYDLIDHNVIVRDGAVSLIDIESVLPVGWFEQPKSFAKSQFHLLDVGWPLHTKWRSPVWYAAFLRDLQQEDSSGAAWRRSA